MHRAKEIPKSFASEDEERDWWASHDLSGFALDELTPRYDDFPYDLITGIRASEAPQVKFTLTVARRHLGAAARSKPHASYLKDARLQNTAVGIALTTDAIEAALNLFVIVPFVIWVTSAKYELKKNAVERCLGMSLPDKLQAVLDESQDKPPRAMIEALDVLILRRNQLFHALPKSYDGASFATGPSQWDVDNARSLHENASSFLHQLWLAPRGSVPRGFQKE